MKYTGAMITELLLLLSLAGLAFVGYEIWGLYLSILTID